MPTTGRCLCGDIVYEFSGDPLWIAYCHCESCRRHTSSAVAAFVGVAKADFRFLRGRPATYHSSPGVTRSFCARCGSPMTYEGARWADEVHIYIGTLSDPAGYVPTRHVHAAERLPWFEVYDTLPRHHSGDEAPSDTVIGC